MAIIKQFKIYAFGVFLTFSGISGVLSLVASINIEEGLGTGSLAVGYAASVFAGFFVPMCINKYGCKRVVVITEILYFLFVLSNMYPSYNIIIGGLLYGISEASWSAFPIITTRFATNHSESGSKSSGMYKNNYIGYLYTATSASFVFGNAAGFLILYIDRRLSNRTNFNQTFDYSICGANDCQISNVTEANLEQYTPAFVATRYIVIGVFMSMILTAIVLHSVYLTNDGPNSNQVVQNETNENLKDIEAHESIVADAGDPLTPAIQQQEETQISGFLQLKVTIKSSLKLFVTPKHLLVMLLPLYSGMALAFVLGELTRAFGACILGLDKVSLSSIIFGFGNALFSYIAGKVAGIYGRNLPCSFAFLLDMTNYIFCLVWQITSYNSWLVYVLFFSFGITDGMWLTLTNVMYEEYFPEQSEIAHNVWNFLVNFGNLIPFALSTYLCVYYKLYLQIVVLCLAMITYGISQCVYYRSNAQLTDERSVVDEKE